MSRLIFEEDSEQALEGFYDFLDQIYVQIYTPAKTELKVVLTVPTYLSQSAMPWQQIFAGAARRAGPDSMLILSVSVYLCI